MAKKCLAIFFPHSIINVHFYLICYFLTCRLPQIYEEFYHTINNADHNKDLKWWSNNHGVSEHYDFYECTFNDTVAFLSQLLIYR